MTPEKTATQGRRWPWLVFVPVLVVAFGVGAYLIRPRPHPLANDLGGTKACSALGDWLRGKVKDPDTGRPEAAPVLALAVSKWVAIASTPGIHAAMGPDAMATDTGQLLKAAGAPESMRFIDLKALHQACLTAGVKMPAYNPPT